MSRRLKSETISITIRCYVPTPNRPCQFELGKAFSQQYPSGTTLKYVLDSLLGPSVPEVGVIAINGKLINEEDIFLKQADHVDIFPLIGGG